MKMYTLIYLTSLWLDSLYPEPKLKNRRDLTYSRTWRKHLKAVNSA